MSGGVDSSVAAILLKKAGYNVIGLFMRNWDSTINNDYLGNPNLNNNICPQEQDYNDALEVCRKINIPHIILFTNPIHSRDKMMGKNGSLQPNTDYPVSILRIITSYHILIQIKLFTTNFVYICKYTII